MLQSCLSSIVANAVSFTEKAATTSSAAAVAILIAFPLLSFLNGQEIALGRSHVHMFFSSHNCHHPATTMMEKIKGTNTTDDDEDESICVVCISQVCEGEKYRILPNCRHVFHAHCIDAWLQRHSTCPLCRSQQDQICKVFLSYLVQLMDHVHTWLIHPLSPEIMSDINENNNTWLSFP